MPGLSIFLKRLSTKMRIAILHYRDSRDSLGGDHIYLLNLSRGLVNRGHEAEILGVFSQKTTRRLWGARFKRLIYSTYMLSKASKLNAFDIVLFAEPIYPQNMLLLRYLELWTKAHIILYVSYPRLRSMIYYMPIRNKFPALIVGENARPFAETIATSVRLVSPGIDLTKLYPLTLDKKWDLLYIGSLHQPKGVLLLLQAMKLLKSSGSPLKLKIIHPPSVKEKLYRRYIWENELTNVDMERAIITDHISIYNRARVFVYPGISYNRVLDFPMTILEASACGLPVVCTSLYRHLGLPNMIFADQEAKSLASALLLAAGHSNPKACDEAVAIIREKYSLTSMGSRAESFFAEVVDGK
jgi:glycosyltransferase involved in cell wall biosynthesis